MRHFTPLQSLFSPVNWSDKQIANRVMMRIIATQIFDELPDESKSDEYKNYPLCSKNYDPMSIHAVY